MLSSCDTDDLTPIEDALATLLANAVVVSETETVDIDSAIGRALSEDIFSPIDSPPFTTSAMDGYAVNSQDIGHNKIITISQHITAGELPTEPLRQATAARIFTGAPLPENADTVVLQESCIIKGSQVTLPDSIKAGLHVRLKGCHINQGSKALNKGDKLGPREIGLAASIGINTLPVYRRIRVALLTTGDELTEPGLNLKPGQIYNANHYLLLNLLKSLNCEVMATTLCDDAPAITENLANAAQNNDIIISSGGVSVGEKDFIKKAASPLGKLELWRIKIKPGKPMAFGHVCGKPFLGLPGNPVSSFVTFCLLARPLILRSQGLTHTETRSIPVSADFDHPQPNKRREYLRATLATSDNGQLQARPYPSQDSATLLSITHSDGLLCIPEDLKFKRGEVLPFIPFSELLS